MKSELSALFFILACAGAFAVPTVTSVQVSDDLFFTFGHIWRHFECF